MEREFSPGEVCTPPRPVFLGDEQLKATAAMSAIVATCVVLYICRENGISIGDALTVSGRFIGKVILLGILGCRPFSRWAWRCWAGWIAVLGAIPHAVREIGRLFQQERARY